MSQLSQTDVFILCGGLGTRLRDEIGESQKVMTDIDGRPFLDIHLQYLSEQGFNRVTLCTGYKSEDVQKHYKKGAFNLNIEISNEDEPLGTGGGLKNARECLKSRLCFVLNGDSFCPLDYEAMLQFHLMKKAKATIALTKVDEADDFGTVTLDEQSRIQTFQEKVKAENVFVNAGVYCLTSQIMNQLPDAEKFSLEKDFFPLLVAQEFYGHVVQEPFYDIGTKERLEEARKHLGK